MSATYSSPALLNHCRRSYVWAAALGDERGIDYDAELLYVSAMLHDIGLVEAFDNATLAFEDAGGHVAWVFGAGAGWPVERRQRAHEVIVRHMWDSVDVEADPEGYLLEVATGLDISGPQPAVVAGRPARRRGRADPASRPRGGVHRVLRQPGAAQAVELRRLGDGERHRRAHRGQPPRPRPGRRSLTSAGDTRAVARRCGQCR